jgi:hypothetical protein
MTPAGELDRNPAGHDMRVEFIQLGSLLANPFLDYLGGFHVAKGNLNREYHSHHLQPLIRLQAHLGAH